MQFIPNYIKDTTEFSNKLAISRTISPEVLLVTTNVTSLNAIIPHVDGVDACSKFLNELRVTYIYVDVLCSLISFILMHNNFVFDDHSYLQTSGTALDTKMAPCFVAIFWHLMSKPSLTTHHGRLYLMCGSLTTFLSFGLIKVKNLNNIQPEPTQPIFL